MRFYKKFVRLVGLISRSSMFGSSRPNPPHSPTHQSASLSFHPPFFSAFFFFLKQKHSKPELLFSSLFTLIPFGLLQTRMCKDPSGDKAGDSYYFAGLSPASTFWGAAQDGQCPVECRGWLLLSRIKTRLHPWAAAQEGPCPVEYGG